MLESGALIGLIEVAVSQPTVIGENRQGPVLSGIAKRNVTQPVVTVRTLNIDGDGQADLRAHGGPDKAIYCYPRQHRSFWHRQLGYAKADAPFGENLSVEGIDEGTACIGDTWRWGTALLQVSQPRWPCYKLEMHSGQQGMIKAFVASGRSGWYLRVLEEGEAPTRGAITIVSRDPQHISVASAFRAARGDVDANEFAAINAHPALAEAWRR